MTKVLRSLIHELFPKEMIIELDLLARQRVLINDRLQEKLFNIIRKYGVDLVALGMGTNRYGFKYNSFAIKFATNYDGRIDNLKEFKMSPELQPHVIRVYECMQNGLLLTSEYIRPFDSFQEMMRYETDIRRTLKALSNYFLIGDIGLSSDNYGNWGVPIGDTVPKCLDFAYVFDVSSSLLLCNRLSCAGGVMLIPTNDYSKLQCPNCNNVVKFQELRIRIKHDDHIDEIGDLSKISYALTSSNIPTELDELRSSYLKPDNKKQKKKVTPQQPIKAVDDFIIN